MRHMSLYSLVFSWPSGPNSFNFSSLVMFYTSDHSHCYPLPYLSLIKITFEVHCLQLDVHQGEWENYSICLWGNTPTYHMFGFLQQLGSSFFCLHLRIIAQISFWSHSCLVIHASFSIYEKDCFCLQTDSHTSSYALHFYFFRSFLLFGG